MEVGGGVLISIQGAGVETFDWLTRGMGVVQTCTRGLEIIALYWLVETELGWG